MKRKMVFVSVFFVLFVMQGQAVFAQRFRMDINGGIVNENGQRITDRIQLIAGEVRDSGMAIVIEFKDGSSKTYVFIEIDEVDDGYGNTTWSNIRMVNPNTGNFYTERFTGASRLSLDFYNAFQFYIKNSQGTVIFQAAGVMRFF